MSGGAGRVMSRTGTAGVRAIGILVLGASLPPDTIASATAAAAAPPETLDEIQVVATGLFPGIGVDATLVPNHVQHIGADSIARQHEHDVGEVLNSGATSISVNDTQGNPFQRDVTYRGFTASPVLGTPQGMSVFIDGVRVNEAFGDTLSWDLIPSQTIAQLDVVPGSDPVYGLNTLAGAIAIQTKRGTTNPGSSAECTTGSYGRVACGAEAGGTHGVVDYFTALDTYRDAGWGEQNQSSLQHYFGRVGLRAGGADLSLSASLADDALYGNQTIPLAFLSDPGQAYTYPDTNRNRLLFLNLFGSAPLGPQWLVAGSVHLRRLQTNVFNSNVNGEFDPTLGLVSGNAPTGNAINDIKQTRPGASLQTTNANPLFGLQNSLTVGLEWERGSTDFVQFNQDAGYSRDTTSSAPALLQTNLHALNELDGAYINDNIKVSEHIALTLAGRYSRAHTRLTDNIGTANNGDDVFAKFLPAAGLTYQFSRALRLYTSYSEGMRVPSPVELTCADPNAPCQLPNAFASDPPLQAVVAQTYEFGADGRLGADWTWNTGVYRTTLINDIAFIGAGGGSPNSGYFQNVGSTRRQGFEAGLGGRAGRATLTVHYSYTQAQFRSALLVFSPQNTTAGQGVSPAGCASVHQCSSIAVQPGNSLPGVPMHNARARVEYALNSRASVAVEGQAQSAQYARGDENNRDARGPVPGFVIFNLDVHYAVSERLNVFARAANIFNAEYWTFGELGTNYFTGPQETYVYPTRPGEGGTVSAGSGSSFATQFRSIGPPRGAWVGVSYAFGERRSGSG